MHMDCKKQFSGGFLVFMAALCWSTNAPLVKYISLDPLLLAGIRALIAGLCFAPFIPWRKLYWNRWLLVYSLSYCALSLILMICLKLTSAAIAVGMQYTSCVWLFLLAILQKKRFPPKTYAAIIIIIAGIVLFMLDGGEESHFFGNLLSIGEGLLFAAITYSANQLRDYNPLAVTAIANLTSAILIFAFLPPSIMDLATVSLQDWPLLLFLGAVQVGGGYTLFNLGSRSIRPQKASIIALWEIILGPIWVALFLHEYPAASVAAGLIVIFTGVLLYMTSDSGENQPAAGR